MTDRNPAAGSPAASLAPAWAAVFAMSLGVFSLVGAEFLPASLLTPMAADLDITEGLAGQAVTATAAMGVIASLTVAALTHRIDRRRVLIGFSLLLILSNLIVALAGSVEVLLAGRLLLGAALGGFWSLSTAVVMRLVPEANVPKALSIMVSGVSAATIFAAPVGSYLGDLFGWRYVFAGAAGLAALVLAVQMATLPSLPPRGRSRFSTLVELMSRRDIALAMLAVLMVFSGHMSLFTYIRPFLETVTGIGVTAISATLLAFGIANFVGNYLGSVLVARSLRLTLALAPLAIAALAFLLTNLGASFPSALAIVTLWGLAFGTVPVAWSAWISRAVADEAESAGGLLVAAINLAIAAGAAVGGLVLDLSGVTSVFLTSGSVLVLATLTVLAGVQTGRAAARA
ncbi:MFS transporter [Stappia sp. 28M-7]|uniref:MFS transporter n=1 Tax=Stappia sp. 28M-7 TaxID=2762596 RepID=UPI00163C9961|nr:MFS transporter [Stappia sp. 28M-7]MBC2860362.1 MFS transporter [Stappia sp. 28M-7]